MGGRIRAILLLLLWFGAAAALPPEPPGELKKLVGEYRSEGAALTVYEESGTLFADGFKLHRTPLRRLSGTRFSSDATPGQAAAVVIFEEDRSQRATVVVAGTRLQYKDIGAEVVQTIRAGVKADTGQLRAAALAAKPPAEPSPRRAFELVDLATLDPGIKFDIRYASSNNFIGFPLYERPAAFYSVRPPRRWAAWHAHWRRRVMDC